MDCDCLYENIVYFSDYFLPQPVANTCTVDNTNQVTFYVRNKSKLLKSFFSHFP